VEKGDKSDFTTLEKTQVKVWNYLIVCISLEAMKLSQTFYTYSTIHHYNYAVYNHLLIS